MKRFCLALDLKENEQLIKQYEHYHSKDVIWPEIEAGIKECGILRMDIYRLETRLMMVLEANDTFELKTEFEKMTGLPRQKEWAELMSTFQQKLPFAKADEYWMEMKQIFTLK